MTSTGVSANLVNRTPALVRRFRDLDGALGAVRALHALNVNYTLTCRKVGAVIDSSPDRGRREWFNFAWVLTIDDPLNEDQPR